MDLFPHGDLNEALFFTQLTHSSLENYQNYQKQYTTVDSNDYVNFLGSHKNIFWI